MVLFNQMIYLKVFAIIILFLIALFQEFSSKKLKNTKPRKSTLIGLMILSVIVGVITTISDDIDNSRTIAEQRVRYTLLQSKHDSLLTQVDSLIFLSKLGDVKSEERSSSLNEQIKQLRLQLAPFIKLAISKYPLSDVDSALVLLSKEMAATKEMARPNSLVFVGQRVKKSENGVLSLIQFRPTKNIPFGTLTFKVSIISSRNSKVLSIEPSHDGGPYRIDHPSQISSDGKSAILTYYPITGGNPTISLTLTSSAHIIIEGNVLEVPLSLQIE